MLTLKQSLTSKTIWSSVVLVTINALQFITDPTNPLHLSPQVSTLLSVIAGAVAVYGRVKPVQGQLPIK